MKRWLVLIFILVIGLIYFINRSPKIGSNEIPVFLQLKVSKERILRNWEVDDIDFGKIRKYQYASELEVTAFKESNKVEDISLRTPNSYTFKTGEKRQTVFLTDNAFVKNKWDGKWFQTEYATTTIQAFESQLSLNWYEKILNKILPSVWADTGTFYPDTTSNGASVDGSVERTDGIAGDLTWDDIRDGIGNSSASTTAYNKWAAALIMISGKTTTYRILTRSIFNFDTSSLPDTSIITSATFSFFGDTEDGYDAAKPLDEFGMIYYNLTQAFTASNNDIIDSDYENTRDYVTDFSSEATIMTVSTSTYNNLVLNSSGIANISKIATSKFAMRLIYDIDDITPASCSYCWTRVGADYAEISGTDNDPKLTVEYTISPALNLQNLIIFE